MIISFYVLGELFEKSQSSDLFLQIIWVSEDLQASFTGIKLFFLCSELRFSFKSKRDDYLFLGLMQPF